MKYKICKFHDLSDNFIIENDEMTLLINNGIFDDCPDESNNPTYDESDDTIVGVFSGMNVPIIAHRLKYFIKISNITNKNILNLQSWLKNRSDSLIIYEYE